MCEWLWTEAKDRGYILLCPQSPNGHWKNREVKLILAALAWMNERYRLDPDRMSLWGYSTGALLATSWGLKHPELWRCICAHAGVSVSGSVKGAVGKISLRLSVGSKDEHLGPVRATWMKLQKAGLDVVFDEYDGMEHASATPEVWAAAFDFCDERFDAPEALLARGQRATEEERWADAIGAYEALQVHELATEEHEQAAAQGLADLNEQATKVVRKLASRIQDPDERRAALELLALALDGVAAADLARQLAEE
jgi:pimeloyl-ACP methyl ester carboxylesterase